MSQRAANSIKRILPKAKSSVVGQLDIYPAKVRFASQNPGEKIFILVRRHVFTNIGWLLRAGVIFILPIITVIAIDVIGNMSPELFPDGVNFRKLMPDTLWVILGLIYYTSLVTYVFAKFLDWYFDIYLVTSERFLHMEFKILTGKFVSEAPLSNIQDVKQRVVGLFPAIFNYGDVIVTTAAERGKFSFEHVPDPTWFRDVITDLAKLVEHSEP
ncbi:MAG: hypothetical protein ACE5DX_03185 [Candidatus Dojkabacteria bacterium]